MYYTQKYWDDWWDRATSVSFFNNHYNVVNTAQYDIINGEAVERKDYKIKRLKEEKESLERYVKHCEKAIIEYSKRVEEIDKQIKDLE
jgi:predicted RNase H-like nuclease (RuvC/YqgF family)